MSTRWPILFALIPLLLPGCYVGPVFKLKKQSKRTCDASFLEWTGGLTHHVAQGSGNGEFSYDPPGDLVDLVEGSYDLKTGDFSYVTTYEDDSFRVSETASGAGTIWSDGDMEVVYDLDITYADDTERTYAIHSQRYGCKEITRIEDEDGGLRIVEGTYEDEAYTYEHEWIWGPLVVSGEGERTVEGWEEEGDVEDGGASYAYTETSEDEGEITHEFDANDGVHTLVGSWTVDGEGEISMDYTSKLVDVKKETWIYTVDGSGDGGGSWSQEDVTCDLDFTEFACKRKACSDDSNGPCTPPVAFPPL